ncbi:Elongation of very long chain fatty acids protein 2 [Galemys pyrenaicus]|uniref:very-long-chain 3-oxoacyl-CoA synthase n=1 Tax=Galemys pyrenaicus TaxID=202257 RepID=A0A8J6DGK8_GALPY|nr:Elongation of very long chain fatty acids protein 2 [Galemys pyrenaicus]
MAVPWSAPPAVGVSWRAGRRPSAGALQVQFLLTITHTLSAVVRPCGFPHGCLLFQSSYMMTLVVLFLNFYVQTYRKKPPRRGAAELPAAKEATNGFAKAHAPAANGVTDKKAQ